MVRLMSRSGLPLFACILAGCARGDGAPTLYPVSGKLLVDGKPLTTVAQGSVSFRADQDKGNETLHQPTGAIDASGRYDLITIDRKGAPPGWYRVIVSAYANKLEEGPVTPRPVLDPKYYSIDTTDLRIEVVAAPPAGAYDLHVTRPGGNAP